MMMNGGGEEITPAGHAPDTGAGHGKSSRWKSTLRTIISAFVGIVPVMLVLADELDIDQIPVVAAVLGVAAGLARTFTSPAARTWIDTYLGGDYTGKHRADLY